MTNTILRSSTRYAIPQPRVIEYGVWLHGAWLHGDWLHAVLHHRGLMDDGPIAAEHPGAHAAGHHGAAEPPP